MITESLIQKELAVLVSVRRRSRGFYREVMEEMGARLLESYDVTTDVETQLLVLNSGLYVDVNPASLLWTIDEFSQRVLVPLAAKIVPIPEMIESRLRALWEDMVQPALTEIVLDVMAEAKPEPEGSKPGGEKK